MAFFEYRPTSTLFYYTNAAAFEGIVKSKQLWLSDITSSNDPRELRLGLDALAEAMISLTDKDVPGLSKREIASFVAAMNGFARRSTFYTCCFSLAADQLPMWREYSAGGEGLCIGFRPTAITGMPGRMQLVQYASKKMPESLHQAAVQAAINLGGASSLERVLAMGEAFASATALKHTTWEYEREVRLGLNQTHHRPDPAERLTQFVSIHEDGEMVPWREPLKRMSRGREVSYLAQGFGRRKNGHLDASRAIDSVTLGPRCAMSRTEASALLQAEGFTSVSIIDSACAIQ